MRFFDVSAARAEIEGRTRAIRATRAIPATPNSTNSTNSTPRDLARDLFEERAAIREHDGGQSREEAEALAVEDVARALGLPVDEVRAAVVPEAPVLVAEGLPCAPCTRCGGGDWWKPMALPFEGEGWRCDTCHPPKPDDWRHAASVPTG